MTESQKSALELQAVFAEWTAEHRQVEHTVQALIEWTNEHIDPDANEFSEAALRLRNLGLRLDSHFAKEDTLGSLLAKSRGVATPEIEAVQRQADKDHTQLSQRLHALVERMERGVESSTGWKSAVYELNLFLDLLEQHEELEAENVRWLITSTASNCS